MLRHIKASGIVVLCLVALSLPAWYLHDIAAVLLAAAVYGLVGVLYACALAWVNTYWAGK